MNTSEIERAIAEAFRLAEGLERAGVQQVAYAIAAKMSRQDRAAFLKACGLRQWFGTDNRTN